MIRSQTPHVIDYFIFTAGAARSYRDNASCIAVGIMRCGVLFNFFVSMLPLMSVSALKMNLPGTNGFLAALCLRNAGRFFIYHCAIIVTRITWFIDHTAFLYGIYTYPLHA